MLEHHQDESHLVIVNHTFNLLVDFFFANILLKDFVSLLLSDIGL